MNSLLLTFLTLFPTLFILSLPAARAQNPTPAWHEPDAGHLLSLGDVRYAAFNTEAAISAFERAHAIDPENPEILVRLARTWNDRAGDLYATGDERGARAASREAMSHADRLVAKHPEDARSWFYLAASTGTLALFSDGREKLELGRRIEETCRRSLDLDSTYALPHIALGMYYREVAELSRLRRFVANRLLGGLPDQPQRRALIHMATAERLSPDLPVIVFQRARTLEQFGRRDEARDAYGRFVSMEPMNSRDYRNLRETLARFDELDADPALHEDLLRENAGLPANSSANR